MVLIRHNSFLELSFGFICCCLITFPAFLEHHGTTVMSWLRSRTNSSRGSNSRGTASPHSEKRRQSPKTDENDKHSFNSFNSADARLTFATAPAGLVQSADLETGELHDLSGSSSRSRLEHDLWTLPLFDVFWCCLPTEVLSVNGIGVSGWRNFGYITRRLPRLSCISMSVTWCSHLYIQWWNMYETIMIHV